MDAYGCHGLRMIQGKPCHMGGFRTDGCSGIFRDAFPLFSRQLLAFFTDVNAMAAPTEFLVWTRPAADSAIMSHGLRPNQEAKILSIRCARSRAVSRLAAWLL